MERLELEHDRDRAVVDELDRHTRSEAAGLDVDAQIRSASQNASYSGSAVGPAAAGEARSVPFWRVVSARSVNWLTTSRTAGVEHAAIEAALPVLEDPQPGHLARQPLRLGVAVPRPTPSSTHRPGPISPTTSSRTRTRAADTRCTTAFMLRSVLTI